MGTTQHTDATPSPSSVRRLHERGLLVPILGVVLMAVLVVGFMPKAMTGRATAIAVDMLEEKSPWRDAIDRPPDVTSPLQTDQVEYTPALVRFWEDLRGGEYTLWLDGHGGGQPLGTLPLTALVSPASWVFLVFPPWFAVGLRTALMLMAGYGGTYLLLRRLDVAQVLAVVGGIAYAFCGTNLVYINRLEGAVLLPAVLWGLHRLAERPTARRAAVPAVVLAVTWLEGFPAIFVFCVYLGAAWYAWLLYRAWPGGPRMATARRWLLPRVVAGGASVVWAAALAMVQLLPFVVFITSTGALEVRNYDARSHINPLSTLGILDVELFGEPTKGPWYMMSNPYEGLATAGLLVSLVAVGVGLLAVAGRLRGSRRQRDAWPWFAVMTTVVLVLCYFGTPLLGLAYRMPGLSENGMWRVRFALNLGMVVLAALGADALWRRRPDGLRFPRWSTAAALAAAVVPVAWQVPEVVRRLDNLGHRRIAIAIGIQLLVSALAVGLWWVSRSRRALVGVAVLVTAGVLFSQLAWPLRKFTPESPVDDFYPTLAAMDVIAERNADQYRFAASEWNFYPNSAVLTDMIDLRGQTIRTSAFKDLVSAAEPAAFARDPLKIILVRDEWQLDSPALDELSVRLFALGTLEEPYGARTDLDPGPGSWEPAPSGTTVASAALEPLAGVALPLRAETPACDHAHVELTLVQSGRDLATTSRPAYDAQGDWVAFGLLGQDLDPGAPAELRLDVTGDDACEVSVGRSAADPGRAALRTYAPDPALPLVSTEQAWIYERPTALPLVRAYGTWQSFPTQAELLDELRERPPAEVTTGLVTGDVEDAPATPSEVEVLSSTFDDGTVTATVRSSGPALVTGGNDLESGWRVTVDGEDQPLVAVDGAILGTIVPGGEHRVEFTYRPRSFVASLPVTALALLAVVAAAADVPGRVRRASRARRRGGRSDGGTGSP